MKQLNFSGRPVVTKLNYPKKLDFHLNSSEKVYPVQLVKVFLAIQTAFFRVPDECELCKIQDGLRRVPQRHLGKNGANPHR